jgi:hypothetical protein
MEHGHDPPLAVQVVEGLAGAAGVELEQLDPGLPRVGDDLRRDLHELVCTRADNQGLGHRRQRLSQIIHLEKMSFLAPPALLDPVLEYDDVVRVPLSPDHDLPETKPLNSHGTLAEQHLFGCFGHTYMPSHPPCRVCPISPPNYAATLRFMFK